MSGRTEANATTSFVGFELQLTGEEIELRCKVGREAESRLSLRCRIKTQYIETVGFEIQLTAQEFELHTI